MKVTRFDDIFNIVPLEDLQVGFQLAADAAKQLGQRT